MITLQLKIGHIAHRQYLAFTAYSLRSVIISRLILITLGLCMVILAARAGAIVSGSAASPADPFAAYRSIMPGQPTAALEDYVCLQPTPYVSVPTCEIYPEEGLFYLISVTTRDHRISEVNFFSDTLQFGDVIPEWSDLDSIQRSENGRTLTVEWNTEMHQFEATLFMQGTLAQVRLIKVRMKP